jgi:alpha-D-ribose 1-methylphosphonate 5-phosphate C-P lyase
MDLILLVLVLCIVGFLVYLATTKIPMPPYWATGIQILAAVICLFFVLRFFGVELPNMMRGR